MNHIVVCISWVDKGEPHSQMFGPFPVAEDDSHLAAAAEFTGRWMAANGQPSNVMLYLVEPPEVVGAQGCDDAPEVLGRARPDRPEGW